MAKTPEDVIRREIDMGLDDPDNAATRLLLSTAFTRDPRRHPVIGHRHLSRLERLFEPSIGQWTIDHAPCPVLVETRDPQP